jgi:hypothetical protein
MPLRRRATSAAAKDLRHDTAGAGGDPLEEAGERGTRVGDEAPSGGERRSCGRTDQLAAWRW